MYAYEYAAKNGEDVKIGLLSERVIDKRMPSLEPLSGVLSDKCYGSLLLYRPKQNFARERIRTVPHWFVDGPRPNEFRVRPPRRARSK